MRKCSRSNELLELDVQQVDYAVDKQTHSIDPFAFDCPFYKTASCANLHVLCCL